MTAVRQTQSRKSEEDNRLILYRLDRVESAVLDVGAKVDQQDNIKKSDLIEFRDTIVNRIHEIRDGLQKQVDELEATKADKSQVDDLRTLVKAVGTALTSVITGLVIFYLTRP